MYWCTQHINRLLRDIFTWTSAGKAPPRPAASLTQALTREALELLEMLIQEQPGTITEIAQRTGRAQPNISRSLQRLAALGLVRLNRKGREVTPQPIAGSLRIDLTTGTYEASLSRPRRHNPVQM